jgi:hypothetical protein
MCFLAFCTSSFERFFSVHLPIFHHWVIDSLGV